MRTFHVITVTLAVEQLEDSAGDQSAARTLASTAVRHACALATDVSGRLTAIRSIAIEPIKVIELEKEDYGSTTY